MGDGNPDYHQSQGGFIAVYLAYSAIIVKNV